MAIQTVRSLRNFCLLAIRHRMAELAFQTQVSMAPVAEFDGLFNGLGGNGRAGLFFVCQGCERQDC
jgi:hypothetical protein